MKNLLRISAFLFHALGLAGIAQAAELSPWLGSAEQAPFQLDTDTMIAVSTVNDPLQTGSLSSIDKCDAVGCKKPVQAATTPLVVQSIP